MYGLYLNDNERFIAVEENLWIALGAAKLLSSKLSITICEIPNNIDNRNCFNWTVQTPELPLSIQYPRLVIPKENVFIEKGSPVGISLEELLEDQKFVLTVLKSIFAAKMSDALLNTADRKYFQSLVSQTALTSGSDDSSIPEGFLFAVEKILYLSTTVDEILSKLSALFSRQDGVLPRNLELYRQTFYRYFNA